MRNAVPCGNTDCKQRQNDIFQPGKRAGNAALPDLWRRQLVQQFLDKTQRAEPAADRVPRISL